MTWIAVIDEKELSVDSMKAVEANGEKLIVYRLNDGFYATQSKCTHLMAPLEKGKIIDGARVQCRFHRAEFNIRTGEVDQWANFPPGIQLLNFIRSEKCLKTYPCKVENSRVFVEV